MSGNLFSAASGLDVGPPRLLKKFQNTTSEVPHEILMLENLFREVNGTWSPSTTLDAGSLLSGGGRNET